MATEATRMATEAGTPDVPTHGEAIGAPPYAPSWANVVIDWLERLPGPTWLAYVAAIGLGIGVSALATLLEPTAQGNPAVALVYYAALPFLVLGLISNLDRSAARALRTLRPQLAMDDGQAAAAHRQLTVVPARPAAVIAIGSIAVTPIFYVLDPVGSGVVGYSPGALAFRWAWEALVTAAFLVLVYHTIRQLALISRIHDGVGRIDIFDQAPLYAMSGVTSGTAAGLILLLVPSLFLIPQGADISFLVFSAAWYGFALVMAVAAFFLPLRGMHDRLAIEKMRLQGEVGRRISATLGAINAAVDAGDGAAVEARTKALAGLTTERDLVNRAPTWPWSTGSLTRFVSAVLLPLGLWLATRLLERLV